MVMNNRWEEHHTKVETNRGFRLVLFSAVDLKPMPT
jgi:hypothetical protein